ncbi:hypothetical protein [Bacillus sp. EB600]|uniref:hypothetical protein n=1 Tax=Bacillus sp. EB600 TaxID=2806345 RepID=UPI00210B6F99|nr:hypothetical protein [Bacillus sp. EB600]MCQ6280666.1 hypothetical protein [Bacillus sp. EB600]
MVLAAISMFFISAVLVTAALYFLLAFIKPGVYPPKKVLKSRALTLGCAGGFSLFIGAIFFYFI